MAILADGKIGKNGFYTRQTKVDELYLNERMLKNLGGRHPEIEIVMKSYQNNVIVWIIHDMMMA
jgi:hypothetical protein